MHRRAPGAVRPSAGLQPGSAACTWRSSRAAPLRPAQHPHPQPAVPVPPGARAALPAHRWRHAAGTLAALRIRRAVREGWEREHADRCACSTNPPCSALARLLAAREAGRPRTCRAVGQQHLHRHHVRSGNGWHRRGKACHHLKPTVPPAGDVQHAAGWHAPTLRPAAPSRGPAPGPGGEEPGRCGAARCDRHTAAAGGGGRLCGLAAALPAPPRTCSSVTASAVSSRGCGAPPFRLTLAPTASIAPPGLSERQCSRAGGWSVRVEQGRPANAPGPGGRSQGSGRSWLAPPGD